MNLPAGRVPSVAAASAVLAVAAAAGGIALAAASAPWFSLAGDALSDLGVAPRSALAFNGGLVLAGALGAPYAWALWRTATGLLDRLVAGCTVAALVSLAGVGVFPAGDPLHFPVALGFYLLVTAVFALDGLARRDTTAGRVWLAAAAVHLAQWWLWVAGVRVGPGLAVPELVGAALFSAWVLAGSRLAPLASGDHTTAAH